MVTLSPGATAHQWLDIENIADVTPSRCHEVLAPALRILPAGPNSVEISFKFGCSLAKLGFMTIDPLQPGMGLPPSYP